jgi:hypothetical protein
VGVSAPDARAPRADIVEEAMELVAAAADAGVTLRALGGVAVRLHSPRLERELKDIDVAARPADSRELAALIERMGYASDAEFNLLNAGRRGLYYDLGNQRRLDVFLGDFEMCHRIPLTERLTVDRGTVPLAELLLTKLQVVELNERDVVDIAALLAEHPVGAHDDETINADRIAELCARDWGLWRTTKMNVERVRAALDGVAVEDRGPVAERLDALWDRIQAEPKSGRWRLRDRIGDRKRWYAQPEEID